MKKKVAVLFGGASQEHDVSVVSAQQLMDAADQRSIEVIPIYVDFENRFMSGSALRDTAAYRPYPAHLSPVHFDWGDDGPVLLDKSLQPISAIDCVLPVMHGPFGEDGRLHSHFELKGIPVTGFSAANSMIAMRKDLTKAVVQAAGVAVLPHVTVSKLNRRDESALTQALAELGGYPVVVKPANLGSSIGVGIAHDLQTMLVLIDAVLQLDSLALIEPKVENLREYNIALRYDQGQVKLSAIESPKSDADLLDFKEKYLSQKGGGAKGQFKPSQGMLSLTRDINPDMPKGLRDQIHDYARRAFVALGARGAPRIDFMVNQKTGQLWFTEINPIPGSYGFFLWEAAQEPLLYPELIKHLVDEALYSSLKGFLDPVPEGARLLPR